MFAGLVDHASGLGLETAGCCGNRESESDSTDDRSDSIAHMFSLDIYSWVLNAWWEIVVLPFGNSAVCQRAGGVLRQMVDIRTTISNRASRGDAYYKKCIRIRIRLKEIAQ